MERFRTKLQQSEAYLLEAQRLSRTGSFGWNITTDESSGQRRPFGSSNTTERRNLTIEMVPNASIPYPPRFWRQAIERASSDGRITIMNIDCHAGWLREQCPCCGSCGKGCDGSIEFVGAVMDDD